MERSPPHQTDRHEAVQAAEAAVEQVRRTLEDRRYPPVRPGDD